MLIAEKKNKKINHKTSLREWQWFLPKDTNFDDDKQQQQHWIEK